MSLQDISIPTGLTVLFLGPHPDDFDAVGVTMRRLQAGGATIHVAVDRSGSGIEDGYCSPPTLEVKAAIREEEQRRSCRFFGLPDDHLTFLVLEEDDTAQLLDSPRNTDLLRALLASLRPAWVVLPHGHDTNVGHQRMAAMFAASRPKRDTPSPRFSIEIRRRSACGRTSTPRSERKMRSGRRSCCAFTTHSISAT